jgi:hypothetical protein
MFAMLRRRLFIVNFFYEVRFVTECPGIQHPTYAYLDLPVLGVRNIFPKVTSYKGGKNIKAFQCED